ncbi:SPOR domain-containing protein [Alishewanella sp. SMS8]|uniref:SPOR domain-containing protein n=1 Tax=Alishewanella sp. SMS8 TaxID=2994676 RepID=UPI002741CEBB|nr:SPOR domain-containing protein [Alishewanella sp. SMS8]MDP5459514.1 SPOR domain-containing protein [Alishewanella sp. SMS8]
MKVRGLQQQLANSGYLLPSQRDVLSRLLFQLAFNDFSRLAIIGASGSGKSTLALALAELFSEAEEISVNVAMLQAPIAEALLASQLGKQWFATSDLTEQNLLQRLQNVDADTRYILITDNPELLSAEQYAWILSLPVTLFVFTTQADSQMQLNLTIPGLTLADCEQLLQAEQLEPLALAERFANCQNNLHKLISPAPARTARAARKPVVRRPKAPLIAACVGAALILLFILTSWLNSTPSADQAKPAEEMAIVPIPQVQSATTSPETIAAASDSALMDLPNDARMPELAEAEVEAEPEPAIVAMPSNAENIKAAIIDEAKTVVAEPTVATTLNNVQPLPAKLLQESVLTPEPEVKREQDTPKVHQHGALLATPAQHFVVQIAVLSSENALSRFKRNYPKLSIQVYQRSWQGRGQWVIVSQSFASNTAAKQYVQQLPSALSSAGPFIKSVGAVQQEIKAWQRLQLAQSSQDN